jgi:formate hydrogenlyase transcriptional activator
VSISRDKKDHTPIDEALRKSEARARTLLEVNNAIISSLTQDSLLNAVSKALHRVLQFDAVALILHVAERDTFRILAMEGMVRHFHVGQEIGRATSSVGWVFDHQHHIIRHDLETELQYENERRLLEEGMRSHCVVPLIARGASIGTLNLASKKLNQYSDDDASFFQDVAAQIALALQNMRAFEKIAALNAQVSHAAERSRTLLEINNTIITSLSRDALLQSISKVLSGVIHFDRCAFTLYQSDKETFRFISMDSEVKSDYFRAGLDFDRKDSVAGWVYQTLRAAIRRDLGKEGKYFNDRRLAAEGIKSDCVVPMMARGRFIGTLNVGSKALNQYSEEDAEFLQEVATQVALAVENMQVYEEINALKTRIEAENLYLQEEIFRQHKFDEIIGNSPALLEVLQNIEVIAPTDASVLLHGETGTGKELLAHAIHSRSHRSGRAMVTVNCGAIPSGLVESELFGHIKGSFTGALQDATGRFELADGSTLFLDEVGELPAEAQVKLLRVLQEREFQPVGSGRTIKVDVRIIAATNRNLEEDVRAGRFRSDLFYRLNVLPLRVPALRERRADIPELVLFFLERFCQRFGRKVMSVSQETMNHLVAYDWPGNIRELQNVIERGVVLCRGPVLTMSRDFLPIQDARAPATQTVPAADSNDPRDSATRPDQANVRRSLEDISKEHILRVLDSTGGIIDGPAGAAQILALHPSTLRARMKKLKIRRPAQSSSPPNIEGSSS